MPDRQIEALFRLQRDAVFGAKDGVIVFLNSAAAGRFPCLQTGLSAESVLPDHILTATETPFSAAADVAEVPCTVLCGQMGAVRIYTLLPRQPTEGQRALLSGVSDSMRRSLTTLNMAEELLTPAVQALCDRRQQEHLMIIRKAYYQLRRLCDNLDSFAHLAGRENALRLTDTDLVPFCRDLLQTVSHLTAPGGRTVTLQTELESLFVRLDRQMVAKLLLNLISNSIKYTAQGRITLQLQLRDDRAVLTLRDEGEGLAPGRLPFVFEGVGGGDDWDARDGAGLGLSIVSEIARLHGGTALLSEQEAGLSVSITLPLHRPTDSGELETPPALFGREGIDIHTIFTELSDVLEHTAFSSRYLD